jgi:GT2 family glycosyltransferase
MPGSMGEPVGITDELVICTLNRPGDLVRCLASVALQTRLPGAVRIVDASEDELTREAVEASATGPLTGLLHYERAPRGLTTQRNAGVRAGDGDVVHFVDDDTVLEPSYLEAVMATFAEDRSVVGVGGSIVNVQPGPVSLAKRLFLLDSPRRGRILRSGRCPVAGEVRTVTEVEWLSGCAMSYRRSVFDSLSFDESLEGYGLGEDVQFSYRAGRTGRLVVVPDARIEHLQSPVNRLDLARYTHDELVNRASRVRQGIGRSSMAWYWWSVTGQLVALAASAIGDRSGIGRERLRRAVEAAGEVRRAGRRSPSAGA